MSPYTTLDQVKNVISDRLNKPKDKLHENTTMLDLGMDSLDTAELEMDLEDAFELRMHDLRDPVPKDIGDLVKRIDLVRIK